MHIERLPSLLLLAFYPWTELSNANLLTVNQNESLHPRD